MSISDAMAVHDLSGADGNRGPEHWRRAPWRGNDHVVLDAGIGRRTYGRILPEGVALCAIDPNAWDAMATSVQISVCRGCQLFIPCQDEGKRKAAHIEEVLGAFKRTDGAKRKMRKPQVWGGVKR